MPKHSYQDNLVFTGEFLGLHNIQVYNESLPTPLKQGGGCTSPGKIGKSHSKVRTCQDETVSRGPSTVFQLVQKGGIKEETPSRIQTKQRY